jgi:hypothetical protein
MPPRRHHGGGFRGRRFGGRAYVDEGPDFIEETVFVVPSQLDAIFVPPTEEFVPKVPQAGMTMYEYESDNPHWQRHQHSSFDAGDILPTLVTPDDAKHYLMQVDTGYAQLDASIQSYTGTPSDFKVAWSLQLGTWKAFFATAMATVGWLNTTAVMQQTDRFQADLVGWRTKFQAVGGNPPGPAPVAPGQGIPGPSQSASDITKVVLAVGAVAAIVVFGPTLMKSLSH